MTETDEEDSKSQEEISFENTLVGMPPNNQKMQCLMIVLKKILEKCECESQQETIIEQIKTNPRFIKYRQEEYHSFKQESIQSTEKKINEYKNQEKCLSKIRLFAITEEIKLQLQEYYDENHELRKHDFSLLDDLRRRIQDEENFIFNKNEFLLKKEKQSDVILPFFWKTLAEIMQKEKVNKIHPSYFEFS